MNACGKYRVKVLPWFGRADEADFAAQQVGQFAADRQAQAGAAEACGWCRRRLAETPRR